MVLLEIRMVHRLLALIEIRELLAEWFEALDFESGKPGSNPSLVGLFRKKSLQ